MNIVITGASKGLGKAFSQAFAGNDNQLLLCARDITELDAMKNELLLKHPKTKIACCVTDVSNKKEVSDFAAWCLEFGTPHILINNAGNFISGSITNEPEGILEQMIETNLYSAYHLTRHLLPAMIIAKQGHIFNICSIASIQPYSNGGSYSISKFAMLGFGKNLREELKPHNIKVTNVVPGAVYTNSWSGSGVDENRIMEAADIAQMVLTASKLSEKACVEDIIIRPQLGDL